MHPAGGLQGQQHARKEGKRRGSMQAGQLSGPAVVAPVCPSCSRDTIHATQAHLVGCLKGHQHACEEAQRGGRQQAGHLPGPASVGLERGRHVPACPFSAQQQQRRQQQTSGTLQHSCARHGHLRAGLRAKHGSALARAATRTAPRPGKLSSGDAAAIAGDTPWDHGHSVQQGRHVASHLHKHT